MVKIIITLIILTLTIFGKNEIFLKEKCLNCHQQQQIPSNLLYKRYLMRYSTFKNMKNVIVDYLQEPQKKNSIMPLEFFLKFPMKQKLNLNDKDLNRAVELYLHHFDIKKKLVL